MDEKEIILRCQKGETVLFGLLYDRYFDKIYRFTYYKTMHRETAEDLVSQTFFKALEAISAFDQEKGMFSAWLYRIARNNVIDHYRSKKEIEDIDSVYGLSSESSSEKEVDNAAALRAVKKYLENIKPEQREIVTMRLWDQLSYHEIASITGKTIGTCKMTFSRVIAKLREDPTLQTLLLSLLIINVIV